jgi:sulfite exporter TauE/SafE
MIYILYICFVLLGIITGELDDISSQEAQSISNTLMICTGILPIWFALRQCVNELEKIRKMMEGKEG